MSYALDPNGVLEVLNGLDKITLKRVGGNLNMTIVNRDNGKEKEVVYYPTQNNEDKRRSN